MSIVFLRADYENLLLADTVCRSVTPTSKELITKRKVHFIGILGPEVVAGVYCCKRATEKKTRHLRSEKSWTNSSDHDIIFRQNLRGIVKEVYHARLNDEGRLVIPAVCRRQIGLQPGQEVILKVTSEGLLLTSYDQALHQFQDEVTKLVGPGVSLVDEVIVDRRAEAAKEAGE